MKVMSLNLKRWTPAVGTVTFAMAAAAIVWLVRAPQEWKMVGPLGSMAWSATVMWFVVWKGPQVTRRSTLKAAIFVTATVALGIIIVLVFRHH